MPSASGHGASAVARTVVAEGALAHRFVAGCLPLLGAGYARERRQAADHDVAASGRLSGRALARFPADLCGAGAPRMMHPALLGNQRKTYLCHVSIQTRDRITEKKPTTQSPSHERWLRPLRTLQR